MDRSKEEKKREKKRKKKEKKGEEKQCTHNVEDWEAC